MATAVLQKRNYAKSTRTTMVMIFIIVLLGGYYGYTQYVKFSGAQDALNNEQAQITQLQGVASQKSTDYTSLKNDFDQKYASVLQSLQSVYPLQENYTDLARLFDNFFQTNNTSFDPVFLSDLKFGQSRMDATKDYAVLPFTMTISTTQDNFMKFLQFIENSGSLADKTRLMDISSITINFVSAPQTSQNSQNSAASSLPVQNTSPQTMLNVSVSLDAYFQKPLTTVTAPGSAVSTVATS